MNVCPNLVRSRSGSMRLRSTRDARHARRRWHRKGPRSFTFHATAETRLGVLYCILDGDGVRLVCRVISAVSPMPSRLKALRLITAAKSQPLTAIGPRLEHLSVLVRDEEAASQHRAPAQEASCAREDAAAAPCSPQMRSALEVHTTKRHVQHTRCVHVMRLPRRSLLPYERDLRRRRDRS